MAEEIKYIQLRDEGGVKILPKTLGKLVINNAGDNLGTVEAGAQVNKLEKIKVNGIELTIVNKTANVEIPAAAEYGLASGTPAEGFQSTYFLTKDGVELEGSARINVAKDQFLKAGSVKLCEATDEPIEGLKIGDAYIDLELQENDEHIYIPAKDLVNDYLAGTGIIVDANKIAIDETVVATKAFVEDLDSVKSGITAEKVATYEAHIANADVHVTTEDKAIWSAKQDALNAEQLKAVNSGITAEKLAELEAFADGKQDKLTAEQLAAVNSGFTADDKSAMDAHIAGGESSEEGTSFYVFKHTSEETGEVVYLGTPTNSTRPTDASYRNGTTLYKVTKQGDSYVLGAEDKVEDELGDVVTNTITKIYYNRETDGATARITDSLGREFLHVATISASISTKYRYYINNGLWAIIPCEGLAKDGMDVYEWGYVESTDSDGLVKIGTAIGDEDENCTELIFDDEGGYIRSAGFIIRRDGWDGDYTDWECGYSRTLYPIKSNAPSEIHVTTENKASWNGKVNTTDYESDQIVVDETLESHEDADRELNQLVLFYELVENGTEEPSDEVTTTVDIPEGATIEFKEIA